MTKTFVRSVMLSIWFVSCLQTVNADVITPTNVTYIGTASEEVAIANLDDENDIINSNGLSEALNVDESNLSTVTHAAVTFDAPGNSWATVDPGAPGGDWFTLGENDGSVVFEFDLGGSFNVGSLVAWGYHFGLANGNTISQVTLDFSTDGGLSIDSSQTVKVPLPADFDGATIVQLAPVDANFVILTVTDNHFGGPAGGDRIGIAEVRFLTPSKEVLLGDVNLDGIVDLLDVAPFVERITTGTFQAEADINMDGSVDLLDVAPFVDLLTGN